MKTLLHPGPAIKTILQTYRLWRLSKAYDRANPHLVSHGEPSASVHLGWGRFRDLWRYHRRAN